MKNIRFSFEKNQFSSFEKMAESLLHEANDKMIRIENNQIPNTKKERDFIIWRLIHLKYYFGSEIPRKYRATYNSLWRGLYKLEHQKEFRHPYIVELLQEISKGM